MQGPNLHEYDYELPAERIAQYPLPERDLSKLLCYSRGEINHSHFYELAVHLPLKSLLVFNNTRVIPARLIFKKESGAEIEVMLLEPHSLDAAAQMCLTNNAEWNALVGNLKRWKDGITLSLKVNENLELKAELLQRHPAIIRLHWNDSSLTMAHILTQTGRLPLPPYIERKAENEDSERYQTIYASQSGAVAAPTAGLHFTPRVFLSLKDKSIEISNVTLHVGAGTFQPITETSDVTKHDMHSEEIYIETEELLRWAEHEGPIIAVGTTSLRTLESVYWYAQMLRNHVNSSFVIEKLYPYQQHESTLTDRKSAFRIVYDHLKENNQKALQGKSSIFIFPGYKFRVIDGLITNFHMPKTTLILLIAALLGEDWRKVYHEAFAKNYRFLSYGDSSLLIPKFNKI